MRKLTLYPRMGDSNFRMIEDIVQSKLDLDFKDFMKVNAGLSHYERIYKDSNIKEWEVHQYVDFTEMYDLTTEFVNSYKRKLVPFAFDGGGWHFCLCLDESDHRAIYINRWTDHLPEDQFLKIAESFQDFINGLQKEEEDE